MRLEFSNFWKPDECATKTGKKKVDGECLLNNLALKQTKNIVNK
ncbi:hypothetical protein [Finegoldia magna]